MGDIADMVLNGDLCQECGEPIGKGNQGYPQMCKACSNDSDEMDDYMEHRDEDDES